MIRNVAIVSLSSGIMGEEEIQYEVEIGFRRLREYGLNVKLMPHAMKGLEYVRNHPEKHAMPRCIMPFGVPAVVDVKRQIIRFAD